MTTVRNRRSKTSLRWFNLPHLLAPWLPNQWVAKFPESNATQWEFRAQAWASMAHLDDRNILLNFYNLLKITPTSGSWNFYLIIIYHFLVRPVTNVHRVCFLKSFTGEACTTCVGRLFHKFTIRCVKKCFLMSRLTRILANFISFPLVRSLEENCNDGQPFLLSYLFVNSLYV